LPLRVRRRVPGFGLHVGGIRTPDEDVLAAVRERGVLGEDIEMVGNGKLK